MAHPFINANFTSSKASQLVGLTPDEQTYVERNRLYWKGDHWQGGAGYIGPTTARDDPKAIEVAARIAKLFTSKNVIAEVVSRQANAALGKHPDISYDVRRARKKVPSKDFQPDPANPNVKPPMVDEELKPEEQQAIEEAQNAIQNWLKDKSTLLALKRVFKARLWGGRAYLRLYIPSSLNQTKPESLEEACLRIVIDEPDITMAKKDTDPITRDDITIVKFKTSRDREEFAYEVCFVDDKGLTFIGVLSDNSNTAEALPTLGTSDGGQGSATGLPPFAPGSLSDGLNLRRALTTFELKGDPLITNQVVQNNNFLNLSLTMGGHVMVETGFSEMALTNVELEVEEIVDSRAPGGKREVVKPIRRGGGITNNFIGVEKTDEKGNVGVEQPGIHWKEPSPIDTHISGKELAYRNILEEVHQVHALIAGDATPSGESRKQALEDFVAAALDFKEELDAFGRWLIETVLYLAAAQMNESERFTTLKGIFDSKIYVGNLTVEEQNALLQQVEKKLRSRKSARAILNISDSDAEEEQIKRESALTPPLELQLPKNQPPGGPPQPPKPGLPNPPQQ